jgi:hypothetical protein
MNLDQWKKACLVAAIGSGLMLASATAQAQSVNLGNNAGIALGNVRIAHADALNAGVNGVGASVADGVRVGGQTITSGIQGVVSAPLKLF